MRELPSTEDLGQWTRMAPDHEVHTPTAAKIIAGNLSSCGNLRPNYLSISVTGFLGCPPLALEAAATEEPKGDDASDEWRPMGRKEERQREKKKHAQHHHRCEGEARAETETETGGSLPAHTANEWAADE